MQLCCHSRRQESQQQPALTVISVVSEPNSKSFLCLRSPSAFFSLLTIIASLVEPVSRKSTKSKAKRLRYRRNRRTRRLLARAVADPSFILDLDVINTNLPITRIFLNNIQEDTRDSSYLPPQTFPPNYSPYLSPGALAPSYSPVYDTEQLNHPPDFPQLSPFPSPPHEPTPDPHLFCPPALPPPIFSCINLSDRTVATILSSTYPQYTDPILPGSFTLGPGPIHIPSLKAYLRTAPSDISIPCFTPFTNPIAFPIEYLREIYPPDFD